MDEHQRLAQVITDVIVGGLAIDPGIGLGRHHAAMAGMVEQVLDSEAAALDREPCGMIPPSDELATVSIPRKFCGEVSFSMTCQCGATFPSTMDIPESSSASPWPQTFTGVPCPECGRTYTVTIDNYGVEPHAEQEPSEPTPDDTPPTPHRRTRTTARGGTMWRASGGASDGQATESHHTP